MTDPIKPMDKIEALATTYASWRAELGERVRLLQEAQRQALEAHRVGILNAVKAARAEKARLSDEVAAHPELFADRRTREFAGIKVGYHKLKGRVIVDDEAATIARIRNLLPAEQAELLIRVRENVHKPAVYDLTAGDLRRLGIRIDADTDTIVVRPVDDALDKLVDALLADVEGLEVAA